MICPKCRNTEHLDGARFCMVCGSPLESCEGCENEDKDRNMDCCWYCSRNRATPRRDLYQHKTSKEETPCNATGYGDFLTKRFRQIK